MICSCSFLCFYAAGVRVNGRLPARYLENGDVPGETLHSFAQLASFQSLLLPELRQLLVKVHS